MLRWARSPLIIVMCLTSGVLLTDIAVVYAQDETESEADMAEPSDYQLELNDDAVRAIIEEDYSGAIALLEEARSLGELNVTYLNLGRAYQKLGKCKEARHALEQSLVAPAVTRPPPEFIEKKAGEYLAEVEEQCPENAREETAAQPADESLDTAEATDPDEAVAEPQSVQPPSNVLAWTLTITGVAALAGGGTMLALAAGERDKIRSQPEPGEGVVDERSMREASEIESRANTFETVGLAALAGGAVISGIGAYLFWDNAAEASTHSAAVRLDTDEIQLQWRVQF